MDLKETLRSYIQAGYPALVIETYEWRRLKTELEALATSMCKAMYCWSVTKGWHDRTGTLVPTPDPMTAFNAVQDGNTFIQNALFVFHNLQAFWSSPQIQQAVYETIEACIGTDKVLIFVAPETNIPLLLEKEMPVVQFEMPQNGHLEQIVRSICENNRDVLEEYNPELIPEMATAALGLTQSEAENAVALALIQYDGLTLEAVQAVKKEKANMLKKSGLLELYEPDDLPEIGGLDRLKSWLEERKLAYTPEARKTGLPFPKGILVFGIPGTGKSLTAKTVGKMWGLPLLRMLDIFDKYVGESEKRIRQALKLVETMSPCIFWIDEIEKFFSVSSGDSGVGIRVLGTFLNWMQESSKPVFTVATANNIGVLPPELMRKGRFDEIFFVDLPNQKEREEILSIHLKRARVNPEDFDLSLLVRETSGFTGSEIESAVLSARFKAFSRKTDLDTFTLIEAIQETCPLSVTMKEQIALMREFGQTRARLATTPIHEEPAPEEIAIKRVRKIKK